MYVLGRIIRITFISKVPQRLQIISMYKLNDVFEMNPSQLVDFSFLLSIQQQGTTTEARRWKTECYFIGSSIENEQPKGGLPTWLNVKNPPADVGHVVWTVGQEDSLEKEMATHSRRPWRVTVHGVATSRTRLSDWIELNSPFFIISFAV